MYIFTASNRQVDYQCLVAIELEINACVYEKDPLCFLMSS